MKIISFIILVLIIAAGCENASERGGVPNPDLKIGRMKVSIWPEYDTEGVLVVYEGKFFERDRFPTKAAFIIPKGVRELTDACSLSPKGEHFCQLYDVSSKGDYSGVTLKLPYPDFFIDFQYNPFNKDNRRDFEYVVLSHYPIGELEVNIQKPLRSSGFNVTPVSSKESEDKGFKYLHYTYDNVPQKKEIRFNIAYSKEDSRPSVDIKFSNMTESGQTGYNRGYTMFMVGGVFLLILLGYYRYIITSRSKANQKLNSSPEKKGE